MDALYIASSDIIKSDEWKSVFLWETAEAYKLYKKALLL